MTFRNNSLLCSRYHRAAAILLLSFFVLFLFPFSSFAGLYEDALAALNKKSFQKAFQLFTKDAKQGNPESQFMLGSLYAQGRGVKKNLSQAAHWHEQAAKQDHPQAQYVLAIMYKEGEGVIKDPSQTLYWLEKAAQHNSPDAQYALAVMYDNGDGIPQDSDLALRFYEMAATQDFPRAQTAMGLLAVHSNPPRFTEAVSWFEKAASQGDPQAQCQLGILYEKGRGGLPRDYEQAARWYKKAVKQGDLAAHNELGFLYYNGKGVPQDYILSYALFSIANERGSAEAFQNCYIAASFLPPKLFEKARTLAKNPQKVYNMIGD
ncbi:MAG: sel1 repeat family protein [Syntrophobacterales bacterium]|jgi:TPR repeat protein|nr:sel1 repeat family protein [Syntrophobacterales bacterium]